MEFIAHRINTLRELEGLRTDVGVELDLRDAGDRLILRHDPFGDGEGFREYLERYRHGTMILNIKSERIEHRVLELVREYGIERYFFLDSSFPMIWLLSQEGETNSAVRFSEFESIETVLAMEGRARWVWIDCFTRLPVDGKSAARLKAAGFKLCLVSPELQGQPEKLEPYKAFLDAEGVELDAVCSKIHNYDFWMGDRS